VHILEDADIAQVETMMVDLAARKADMLKSSRYSQQFLNAVAPGGKVNSEGECEALTVADILLHYISITWKVSCSRSGHALGVADALHCRGITASHSIT
jgi:hypothetical protein